VSIVLFMGYLASGNTLDWVELSKYTTYIKTSGIKQFLHLLKTAKHLTARSRQWGDEIEYSIFTADENDGTVQCVLRASELIDILNSSPSDSEGDAFAGDADWGPEYGAWMIEGIPSAPYGDSTKELLRVESNMRYRRARLLGSLAANEICPTRSCFPMRGTQGSIASSEQPGGHICRSRLISDASVGSHRRFHALEKNMRSRRCSNVDICVRTFVETAEPAGKDVADSKIDDVHMDASVFGFGCCCLQVTLQARDFAESRYLHDQLAILAPILMALTAATPFAHGLLLESDVRWNMLSQACDDRTVQERSSAELSSRYGNASLFIAETAAGETSFNDVNAPFDAVAYQTLIEDGVDKVLAHHIAHLFVRDPLVAYDGQIEIDDEASTAHFESIQSTNWNSVRWKPPPSLSDLESEAAFGWRVELRTMEESINQKFAITVIVSLFLILYYLSYLFTISITRTCL